METSEIREGMKVRHQFSHGRSFDQQEFTTGTVVSTEGMKPWRPQLVIELDNGTRQGVFAADLMAP